MAFKDYFVNDFETSDQANNKDLLTHYYRNTYERVKSEILNYCKLKDYIVESVNDDVKEIFVRKGRHDLIITITPISIMEIAVDVKATTYYLIGLKRGLNFIKDLYEHLDKNLNFKGVALYK